MTFDEAHEKLVNVVATSSGPLLVSDALINCVEFYICGDTTLLEKQVQRTLTALWANHFFASSYAITRVLSPYVTDSPKHKLTLSLLDHPDVIRALLTIAMVIDVNNITLNEETSQVETAFLLSLPGMNPGIDESCTLVKEVGCALLGPQWSSICTLYDVPEQGLLKFRQALTEIPDSILHLPHVEDEDLVALPPDFNHG